MIGSLISAAGGLLGGFFNNRARESSARDANAANQRQFDQTLDWSKESFGKGQDWARGERQAGQRFNAREAEKARQFTRDQNRIDRQMQKTFAKKSAGWQFDDLMEAADTAGIHRLAALGGATGTAYQPGNGGTAVATSPGTSPPGFAGSPGAGNQIPEIGGSIIGDGMNAIGDVIATEMQRRDQKEAFETEQAKQAVMDAARMDVMSAEATMYRARAAESMRRASYPGIPRNDPNYGLPEGADREVNQMWSVDGKAPKGVWVGPDLGEIAGGGIVVALDQLRDWRDELKSAPEDIRKHNQARREWMKKREKPSTGSRGRRERRN